MASIRRACDACRRRKVKCDGRKPCRHCGQASLICTFMAVPKKKGPKGNQARVLSEIREAQLQEVSEARLHDGLERVENFAMVSLWSPTPGLLSPEVINGCVEFFFAQMYPTMPILHRQRFYEEHVRNLGASLESYCLVCSLCAFMMIQPGMELLGIGLPGGQVTQDGPSVGRTLVKEVLRVRKGFDYVEGSIATVITSFFLFACYFGLDEHKLAWFYLREATTLAHMCDMDDENTYRSGSTADNIRRRRLFWLLFVTERYCQ